MTNKSPFFSIIIPTLNEENYLPDLLKDLKNQTYQNFEAIVVDANSEDKTQEIAKGFITKIIVSDKKNVAYQRNVGGRKAKGKYLIFFDADTRIPEYYLEGLKYRISISKPDFFTTWTNKDSNKTNDEIISTFINFLFEAGKVLDIPLAIGAMISCHNKVFTKINGFDTKLTYAEDGDFVKRASIAGYNFKVFKDPKYTLSLRRFRKEGTLPAIRKYAKLHFFSILRGYKSNTNTKKDYPMIGGSYYSKTEKEKTKTNLIKTLEEIVEKIKSKTNKETLHKVLKSIFSN